MCVCVCLCVWERKRETKRESWLLSGAHLSLFNWGRMVQFETESNPIGLRLDKGLASALYEWWICTCSGTFVHIILVLCCISGNSLMHWSPNQKNKTNKRKGRGEGEGKYSSKTKVKFRQYKVWRLGLHALEDKEQIKATLSRNWYFVQFGVQHQWHTSLRCNVGA